MTSAQSLIDETKRHLLSGERENLNVLNGAIASTSATTFVYTYTQGGILEGATVEIDSELMYVVSVNTGTKTATVIRGMFGSTAATHANSSIIYVNPRFPQLAILEALNHEIRDLSSPINGLYAVDVELITSSSGVVGYDLSITDFIRPIEVHYEAGASQKWWSLSNNWRVIENANTTDFASGRALILGDSVIPSGEVRLTYAKAFATITAATADVETTSGLASTMIDIPPLGAASRMMMQRAARRVFDDVQGEPRRASEVAENSIVPVASAMLAYRERRIAAEAARLNARYPTRLIQ